MTLQQNKSYGKPEEIWQFEASAQPDERERLQISWKATPGAKLAAIQA